MTEGKGKIDKTMKLSKKLKKESAAVQDFINRSNHELDARELVVVNYNIDREIAFAKVRYCETGLEKWSVLSVLDRFLSLKTDFVLNRKQKKSVHKSLVFPVQFLITVYNSYLSRQFTVNFTPYNTLSCLIRLNTHVLHDLGVSSPDE